MEQNELSCIDGDGTAIKREPLERPLYNDPMRALGQRGFGQPMDTLRVAAPERRAAGRYREPVAYLLVGAWNTLFGYAVFALLYYLLGAHLHVDVILVLSYVPSMANAYIGYRHVVFRSTGSMARELPRFFAVYAVTLAANLVVLPLALRALPWNAYVVQGLFTVVIIVLSYFGHKYFSFRGGAADG